MNDTIIFTVKKLSGVHAHNWIVFTLDERFPKTINDYVLGREDVIEWMRYLQEYVNSEMKLACFFCVEG